MAVEEEDFELDEEQAGEKKKSGRMVKIILIVTVVIVVIAISIVGTMFAIGAFSDESGNDTADNTEKVEQANKKKKANKKMAEVFYESLTPPFVVNFEDKNYVRFLQVGIDIMAESQAGIDAAKKHMPVIRNNIVLLLGDVKYEDISSREGKENLRKRILADIQGILKKRAGDESITDLFFTSFVMQ
jgi:flagellar FliL protein